MPCGSFEIGRIDHDFLSSASLADSPAVDKPFSPQRFQRFRASWPGHTRWAHPSTAARYD